MKSLSEKLAIRSKPNRPSATVEIRLPEDVIGDLAEMATAVGFGSYQALIRAYVSDGLRRHEAMMEEPEVYELRESLKRHGIADEVITEVVAETLRKSA